MAKQKGRPVDIPEGKIYPDGPSVIQPSTGTWPGAIKTDEKKTKKR
ncbi:MAG: hypothetical protein QXO44_00810 [Thermoplasmatales archaeon]